MYSLILLANVMQQHIHKISTKFKIITSLSNLKISALNHIDSELENSNLEKSYSIVSVCQSLPLYLNVRIILHTYIYLHVYVFLVGK